jgi:putative DNA primase/helicase
MTGEHLEGTSLMIEPRQAELDAFHAQGWPEHHQPQSAANRPHGNGTFPSLENDELLQRALGARSREKFARLWAGDMSGYPSHSEADLTLCALLAFWMPDSEQIDRLFRRSELYREKWDARQFADGRTYGGGTIGRALGF